MLRAYDKQTGKDAGTVCVYGLVMYVLVAGTAAAGLWAGRPAGGAERVQPGFPTR